LNLPFVFREVPHPATTQQRDEAKKFQFVEGTFLSRRRELLRGSGIMSRTAKTDDCHPTDLNRGGGDDLGKARKERDAIPFV
jgi:hypothetical protein